jgi:hypothetical protein
MTRWKSLGLTLSGAAAMLTPMLASAQPEPPVPPPGYGGPGSYGGYPPEPPAPQGYDGSYPPPPPPGYQAGADGPAQRDWDQRYAVDAETWARDNCVKAHGDTTTGAVVGGVIGALIGSGVQGRHDHGTGTLAGAALGAVGGAAIANGSGSNETSPGCPPGYVVRNEAPSYAYGETGYYYAAPGWYRPWFFYGGAWRYRPYPYHDWYYRTYRFDRSPHRVPRRGRPGWRDR